MYLRSRIWVFSSQITSLNNKISLLPFMKSRIAISATTAENDGTDKKGRPRTQQKSKLIIIISGVLISTGLFLLIGREIYQMFRMSQVHHNRQTSNDFPEDFNIYAEINAHAQGNVIIQQ